MENNSYFKSVLEIFQHKSSSLQEFLDFALAKAIELTESKLGYIYHYYEDRKEFVLNTWSNEVMKECSVVNPQSIYTLEETGFWGEAVRQRKPIILNNFQAQHPLKKGYPEGHAPLHKFMTIPVFNGDNIVAVVGVANKATDYGETDVLQLTLMMDAVWKVVDHKRSEEKLKKSEEKYRRLAENISDVVWIADLDANLTFITPSVQKLLDETVEENIKKSFNERFTPDSLKKILPMFQEEFEKEQIPGIDKNRSRIIEAEQYKKDGSIVNVSMHISFIRDDEGKPIGFLGVTRDITAQKKAEEEKSKLQIRLMQAQKMESIGRLAGGVAHDFNNMLTVIIGRAELALMKTDPSNPVYKELNEIKNAAERSATLTAQLLAFARKQVIVPKTIQLNDTIVKMFGMLEKLVGENIELQLLPGKNLWDIKIDTTQIDQIIANLCVNSKDAMEDHGRIVIRTENLIINNPDMEKTPGLNKGEYVCLSVSDNGCGMDEETKRHIFEPFFTTKENGEGTGLGLATIYGVVKQNKGYIYIESNPENGSEFTIYFPRQI